jgi:integrase
VCIGNVTLKHLILTRDPNPYYGRTMFRLLHKNGTYIDGFDIFSKNLIEEGYAFTSRKRYAESGARFLDYLYEVGVLGGITTNDEINRAINQYPHFLRYGSQVKAIDPEQTEELQNYAKEIGLEVGLSGNSFAPTLAAVNKLLSLAEGLAKEALFNLKQHSIDCAEYSNVELVIDAINGSRTLTHYEKTRLQQNWILGSVIRLKGKVKAPRKLSNPVRPLQSTDTEWLAFPLDRFEDLINAATNYRDQALWSLLAAGGYRTHEALNTRLIHIDPVNQLTYIVDPQLTRFGQQMTEDEKVRFKGRVTSRTYLFEPLRSLFWKALENYLRHEYVPTDEHDYLFQIVEETHRGIPLKDASATAIIKSFKNAVRRAGIPGPPIRPEYIWTPHSLRHMYGVYMLNYIPVPGGYGLLDTEVQQLMGHKYIASTRHYARHDRLVLEAKLELADQVIYNGGIDVSGFPAIIASRLMNESQKYAALGR